MKAAAFNYARAASVDEAVQMLVRGGGGAKLLAGGQSLLPALNLRLMSLDLLVDITGIAALRGIRVEGGTLKIGAMTRHADLLTSPEIAAHAPLLAKAIAHVAHPAIRNRGTIGGNLAHADPASELPACMLALGATLVIQGPSGQRRVQAADFFLGLYQTALAPDEILIAIELPALASGERAFFHEYARRMGDYAIVGLAAQGKPAGDRIDALRLVYFGVGERAGSCPAAARILQQRHSPAILAEAQAALAADLQPQNDHQASAAMRLHLARTLLARCVNELLGRAEASA
ncbi:MULTISPECIES: xanthine dehydrogenase family protein subunit M [Rhodomicrobium]|uniref:FAD binding domain-containing protein n=1 Tax=Rhodomicrobium TaxID=1068 RepID=UPI000B4B70FD|nr:MULTISPECIES: xanthine dehydrogenase family protein subunit M [Rhodomicrobium]